MLNGIKTVVFN